MRIILTAHNNSKPVFFSPRKESLSGSACTTTILVSTLLAVLTVPNTGWAQSSDRNSVADGVLQASNKGDAAFIHAFMQLNTVLYIAGGIVGAWIISAILAYALRNTGYPPTTARVACWLGFVAFCVYLLFGVFGILLRVVAPLWAVVSLGLLSLVLAIILFATRKHAAYS